MDDIKSNETQSPVNRLSTNSIQLYKTFIVNDNECTEQYFNIYQHRLKKLRPILSALAYEKWGKSINLCPYILECQAKGKNQSCVIIGTIYKEMSKKSSALDQFRDTIDTEIKNSESINHDLRYQNIQKLSALFVSENDSLLLEDEHGRIKIESDHCLDCNRILTGIPVALQGTVNEKKGIFIIENCLLCDLPPILLMSHGRNENINENNVNPKYIAIVSGIEAARADPNHNLSIQLLFDFLSGFTANAIKDDRSLNSSICRVIMAGNILSECLPTENNLSFDSKFKQKLKLHTRTLDSNLKQLECYLIQLLRNCNVDIMPGFNDPTNFLLPQQPFHECLFPMASAFNSFQRCSNPYQIRIDGKLILGTSGQNITDMIKHSELSAMECLELTLRARVIAPTAPDTLPCLPVGDRDPFLIEECPSLYFVGNCDRYEAKYLLDGEVCLLTVPSFAKSKQIVLVDVCSLETQVIQFAVGL